MMTPLDDIGALHINAGTVCVYYFHVTTVRLSLIELYMTTHTWAHIL